MHCSNFCVYLGITLYNFLRINRIQIKAKIIGWINSGAQKNKIIIIKSIELSVIK